MPERSTVSQVVQVGVESTPGTAVAANKFLPSLDLSVTLDGSVSEVRSGGNKFPVLEVVGKEWTTASINDSQPTYDELPYLLSSVLASASPVQQGATTAYLWTFSPNSTSEDTVKTLTVEQGSGVRAHKFAYGLVREWSIRGNRDSVNHGGSMIGRQLQDGITLTASPAALPLVPIFAQDVSVYLDDTSAALGTTKLTRNLSWDWSLKPRYNPLWVVDRAQSSWVAPVEIPIDVEIKCRVEADAQGMGILSQLRSGGTKFLRIEAQSSTEAGTAFPYKLTIDTAVQVSGFPGEIGDAEGVYSIEWTWKAVHDSAWGKALTVGLTNKQSTL